MIHTQQKSMLVTCTHAYTWNVEQKLNRFSYTSGVDPGFLERGSYRLYKGVEVRFADCISFY